MNKSEFLEKLGKHLDKIDKKERDKFITYYDEMIEDYKENGYEETKAIEKIGNIKDIADNILQEQTPVKNKQSYKVNKTLKLTLLILGFPLWGFILLTIAMLILCAYIVIWCIPFTTGASAIGVIITSFVGIIGSPFIMMENISLGIIQLGLGVTTIGVAIILAMVTVTMSKKLILITGSFNLKLLSIFKMMVEM